MRGPCRLGGGQNLSPPNPLQFSNKLLGILGHTVPGALPAGWGWYAPLALEKR